MILAVLIPEAETTFVCAFAAAGAAGSVLAVAILWYDFVRVPYFSMDGYEVHNRVKIMGDLEGIEKKNHYSNENFGLRHHSRDAGLRPLGRREDRLE